MHSIFFPLMNYLQINPYLSTVIHSSCLEQIRYTNTINVVPMHKNHNFIKTFQIKKNILIKIYNHNIYLLALLIQIIKYERFQVQ